MASISTITLVVVMLIGTSQQVFFGGRFPWAANSQSARYDTGLDKGHCSSQSTRSFVLKQCVLLTKPNLAFVENYSGSVKMVA